MPNAEGVEFGPTRVVGPDSSIMHMVVTWKMDTGYYETQVFLYDIFGNLEAAPVDEWHNTCYNDALMAHAVAFEKAIAMERAGQAWRT